MIRTSSTFTHLGTTVAKKNFRIPLVFLSLECLVGTLVDVNLLFYVKNGKYK